MSQGQPIPYADALVVARGLVGALETVCERVEIAGSLRRRKLEVRDIELVAIPRSECVADGLFGTTDIDLLEARIETLRASGYVEARPVENHRADGRIDVQTKLGPAFKALVCGGIAVDLFVVRAPASWGVIYALRTGPGDWNTRLVMDCKTIGRRVAGGQVERWTSMTASNSSGPGWVPVPTPEERDFFAALGQPWVEPPDRRPERVRIDRAIADALPDGSSIAGVAS